MTDDEFVAYSMGLLPEGQMHFVRGHLLVCAVCSREIKRLEQLSAPLQNEAPFRRLQECILAQQSAILPRTPLLTRTADMVRASLRALIPAQTAYGQGMDEDEATVVPFPIVSGEAIVAELAGIMERQNAEYYVVVQVLRPEDRARFENRFVMITITDTSQQTLSLRRRVNVGVTVLLGTDLRLTESAYVEAHLLPPEGTEGSPDED